VQSQVWTDEEPGQARRQSGRTRRRHPCDIRSERALQTPCCRGVDQTRHCTAGLGGVGFFTGAGSMRRPRRRSRPPTSKCKLEVARQLRGFDLGDQVPETRRPFTNSSRRCPQELRAKNGSPRCRMLAPEPSDSGVERDPGSSTCVSTRLVGLLVAAGASLGCGPMRYCRDR